VFENLTRQPTFENISFELYAGDIVGLAGLVGSGRTALVRCIFGLDMPDSGKIYVDEQAVSIQSPRDAVALGMGMLPEIVRSKRCCWICPCAKYHAGPAWTGGDGHQPAFGAQLVSSIRAAAYQDAQSRSQKPVFYRAARSKK